MSRVCQAHVESQPNDRWVVARRFGKDEILTQHLGLECSSDLHRESCYDKPNMCGSFINVASLTTRTDDDDDDDDDDDNDDDNTFDVVAPQPRSSCTQTKVR